MDNFFKRFFYYWRLPILFFILFFVLLAIGYQFEGDAAGVIGAIWLFVDIPCLIFFTIRAIYLRIRNAIRYHRTGVRAEAYVFPEIDFIKNIADFISDEFYDLKELTVGLKSRYFLFLLLGFILIAGGIVGCFFFAGSILMIVLFTLIIIAGATLWISSNPRRYNMRVSGAKVIPCKVKLTEEELCDLLCSIYTSLGTPQLAMVKGFKKPIIIYGSESDIIIYAVYRARFSELFRVSSLYSSSIIEFLPSPEAQIDEEDLDSSCDEFDSAIEEIAAAVGQAVLLAEEGI